MAKKKMINTYGGELLTLDAIREEAAKNNSRKGGGSMKKRKSLVMMQCAVCHLYRRAD